MAMKMVTITINKQHSGPVACHYQALPGPPAATTPRVPLIQLNTLTHSVLAVISSHHDHRTDVSSDKKKNWQCIVTTPILLAFLPSPTLIKYVLDNPYENLSRSGPRVTPT
ncbi:hypothetical protein BDZ91DRAFT_357854 [Kalaharituber pfeilii]|nr:hypothetical protein BDZ91DRAFT_357854 [Kalaharituber pfeilii]